MTRGLLAATISACSMPVLIRVLTRAGLHDRPNARSSHQVPTPRGAGIAVGIAIVAAAFDVDVLRVPVLLALALGAIGLADDVRSLQALPRFVAQIGIGVFGAAVLSTELESVHPVLLIFGILAGALFVAGYVNSFNFMDGVNGISVAATIVAAAAWLVAASKAPELRPAAIGSLGAALGFLPFNAPKARIFLGDSGSYFLGGWIATVSLLGLLHGADPLTMVAPLLLGTADTGTTLIRRIRRRERWHQAHREHIYQQLVDAGWSHSAVALYFGSAGLVLVGLAYAGGSSPTGRLLVSVPAVLVVIGYLYTPCAHRAVIKRPSIPT